MLVGPSVRAVTLTAMTLARLMARDAKVVVVDLAASGAIAAVSAEADAPGLAELMQGDAPFSLCPVPRVREQDAPPIALSEIP